MITKWGTFDAIVRKGIYRNRKTKEIKVGEPVQQNDMVLIEIHERRVEVRHSGHC